MRFFKDSLMVNDPEKSGGEKYSLSRSLLITGCSLYMILIISGIKFLLWPSEGIDIDNFVAVAENLHWFILTFAAYSFGGKVVAGTNKDNKEFN